MRIFYSGCNVGVRCNYDYPYAVRFHGYTACECGCGSLLAAPCRRSGTDGTGQFVRENRRLVKAQQTVELLGINGANIYIGGREQSEADSLMENSFVRQNQQFDYLLDTDNQVLQVSDGEIAVPIYHMQRYNLHPGDKVQVVDGDFAKDLPL